MLITEGDGRTLGVDIRLAAVLAGVAGAVNAAGFQATGFFSANMTGNVSALSDYAALGNFAAAGLFGSLVIAFIAGAVASGLLIEVGRRNQIVAIYALSVIVEAVLLLVVGMLDALVGNLNQSIGLLLGLSFIMGIQNAATTRISKARVRTTHVSGMATDVGLGLASLILTAPDRADAVSRLLLYSCTIVSFVAGGAIGAIGYLHAGGALFLAVGIVLLLIALPQVRRAYRADRLS